jgi:hypothetical protein
MISSVNCYYSGMDRTFSTHCREVVKPERWRRHTDKWKNNIKMGFSEEVWRWTVLIYLRLESTGRLL